MNMSRVTFRRPSHSGLRLVPLALLVALISAACSVSPATQQGEDVPLVIARDMDLNSLDPSRAYCDTCQIYLSAVYETLVTVGDDNATIEARLADSWEANDDATQYTFTLNPDATFSDGSPVEAKDVAFSWLRLKNVGGSASFLMADLESVDTPDAQTVVANLSRPNSEFLATTAAPYTGIINSDVARENDAVEGADAATADKAGSWFQSNSAGSGPYVLDEYATDELLRLTENTEHWQDDDVISEVILQQVSGAVTQAQQLQSNEADIAMQIDVNTAKTLDGSDVVTKSLPSFNFFYLALSPGSDPNLTPEVRKAIRLAIDYQGLIDTVLLGEGKTQAAPIPNGFPGSEALPVPEQDLEQARALMAEAGHSDGLTVEAVYPSMTVYGVDFGTVMQYVKGDLAKAGIRLDLQPVTFSVLLERRGEGTAPILALYFAPDYLGTGQYVSYFGMVPPGDSGYSRNAAGPDNPPVINEREADLFAEALAATDEAERVSLYEEVATEMVETDRIILPLVSPNLILAYRANLEGVSYSVCCNLKVWEISRSE